MANTKTRGYPLTKSVLIEYRAAAISNATELLAESELLLQAGHYARAYFLAVATIEETGKAIQAHYGLSRNLSNPAVCTKLQIQFDDHDNKINAAFLPWIRLNQNLQAELNEIIGTMIALQNGRQPSMYTDISPGTLKARTPREAVRPKVAKDCVALASEVLRRACVHVETQQATPTNQVQDEFFALNQKVFLRLANTEDFWKFFLSRAERGDVAIESAVVLYHDGYFSKGRLFEPSSE